MLRFIAVIELQMQIKLNIHKYVCDNIQGKENPKKENEEQKQRKFEVNYS